MIYNVIGLMSGSSLDGLDIAFVQFVETAGVWNYELLVSETIPFTDDWKKQLKRAAYISVPEFLRLDTSFGRFLGDQVNAFIEKYELWHKVHFIASHGHTVYHNPAAFTSKQIGNGATIAAVTGITTITDLRDMDVALKGQGAPIVPIADKILFSEFDFCLNIGGIANITINNAAPVAFDVCVANQVLNHYAEKVGQPFDDGGKIAAIGHVNAAVLQKLNEIPYYKLPIPKSLDNDFATEFVIPYLNTLSIEDALATSTTHIAQQISQVLQPYLNSDTSNRILITGGGANNSFLVSQIDQFISESHPNVICEVPDAPIVQFKEALAMALIGTLRWREEENVMSSVTGAVRNSIGGAIWIGNQ